MKTKETKNEKWGYKEFSEITSMQKANEELQKIVDKESLRQNAISICTSSFHSAMSIVIAIMFAIISLVDLFCEKDIRLAVAILCLIFALLILLLDLLIIKKAIKGANYMLFESYRDKNNN